MRRSLLTLMMACIAFAVLADSPSDYMAPSDAYRHGYNELTAQEKVWYDEIVDGFINFEANSEEMGDLTSHRCYFSFGGFTPSGSTVNKLLSVVYRDNPEVYVMYTSIYRFDYDRRQYYGRVPKFRTPEAYLTQMRQLNDAWTIISSGLTPWMSEYETALAIHDAYIGRVHYGGMSDGDAGNVVGALINQKAVCEGLSRGYLYLCQRAGLKCIYVEGTEFLGGEPSDSANWGNHAWNFIEINDQWYQVDITVDCGLGVLGHRGFLTGQDHFDQNYRLTNRDGGNPNIGPCLYQALPTLAKSNFVPSTTDIDSVEAGSVSIKAIYDLTGRRITSLSKGINIVEYSDGSFAKIRY